MQVKADKYLAYFWKLHVHLEYGCFAAGFAWVWLRKDCLIDLTNYINHA